VLALSSGFVPLSTGLRIASYNIRSGSGMDDVYNLSRTAEAIRLLNVDIVGLQEVDNNTDRHPHDNQAQVLANLTGLTHHVFAKFRDFENGGYGVAIISRFPIEAAVTLHYSKPSMFGQGVRGALRGRLLPRCNRHQGGYRLTEDLVWHHSPRYRLQRRCSSRRGQAAHQIPRQPAPRQSFRAGLCHHHWRLQLRPHV